VTEQVYLAMASQDEYRKFAQQCVKFAAQSKSDEDRTNFVEMARAWRRVALAPEDVARQADTEPRLT
jgi:hypothetical protein